MATLDTTRLIQPASTPSPTTTLQPKPAEGFQRLLDDETYKVSNSGTTPKPIAADSQPAKALRSDGKRPTDTTDQFEQDSTDAGKPVRAEAGPGGPRSEAPTKATQRRAGARDSKPEAIEGSAEVEAESATRQNLPTEAAQEDSAPSLVGPEGGVVKIVKSEDPAALAQTAATATLLASLLVQTTGDLKGTQVAVEAQPQAAELSASTAIAPVTTPSTGSAAWMSSATPISPDVFEGAVPAEDTPVRGHRSCSGHPGSRDSSAGTSPEPCVRSHTFCEGVAGGPVSVRSGRLGTGVHSGDWPGSCDRSD